MRPRPRSSFEGQLNFFEEPKSEPTSPFQKGDRWVIEKNHPTIYLPKVEVIIQNFNKFNVTFTRVGFPVLTQWCIGIEDFLLITRKL